jgi:hypothetical protein
VNNPNNPLNDTDNWMGSADEPLFGFSTKKLEENVTSEVLFWSDVFLHTNKNGDELAIILTEVRGLDYMVTFNYKFTLL